jgi:hypothetical protein
MNELTLKLSHAEVEKLKRRTLVLTTALIAVILVSLFAINEWFSIHQSTPEFFVGVEFAYGNANELKDLVDKVKNYTNLFVIGSLEISFNQTALNETCDYIHNAGLHFIVLFTSTIKYVYTPFVWVMKAKQKYGDSFLGVYRIDEPGGKQLDDSPDRFVNTTDESVLQTKNYTSVAHDYAKNLYDHIEYWIYAGARVFTADYGLYWFDYKGGYDVVLAEFGWNHSRPINVGLCRGAAKAQGKDWGVMVTWTYDSLPYIESREELYDDMTLAYGAGAKYVVVFDYPKNFTYGILTEKHFEALKKLWDYVHSNPRDRGADEGKVAYVLPSDYGFGFRSASDAIWGFWDADKLSGKVWTDVNKLVERYDSSLDIMYDDATLNNALRSRYDRLFFWNETIE